MKTNMRKHIDRLLLLLIPALALASCTEDVGTEPGNDGAPGLTIYAYDTTAPNDPDVDATYRVATNDKTESLYYFAEPETSAEAASDASIAEKVVSQGTQVTLSDNVMTGGRVADVVVKNMKGKYNVYFVAVSGGKRTLSKQSFTGAEWIDVTTGTYYFSETAQSKLGLPASQAATLQYLKTDPTQCRFKNLYGVGYSLKLKKTTVTGSDKYDTFDFYRVAAQQTSFTYGSYGTISVRDLGYWQNDDSFAYNPGYGCYIYNNAYKNYATIIMQYFVSAGSLGYDMDSFSPDK